VTAQPSGQSPAGRVAPSTGRNALVATAGTALSRTTGFLRVAAMVYALGVTETRLADTYSIANTTPNIVFELILGGVLSSVLLRVYVATRDKQGQQEAWRFLNRVTNTTLLLLLFVCAVGFFAAPWVIRAYTFRAAVAERALQQQVGVTLLRLFVPQILFYGLSYISSAVLQAHRRFGVSMFAPVANNLIAIATFVVFAAAIPRPGRSLAAVPAKGLLMLGLGTTAGVVALGIVPFFYMRSLGWRWSPGLGLTDPRLKELARLSAYMLGYVAANQAGLWVEMVLANKVRGGVAGYQSAFAFFQLPHGLLAVSIAAVIVPGLAEAHVGGDLEEFSRLVARGLRSITFVILPTVAGYIALAPYVIRLLLQHGVATAASTELISTVLRFWAGGIFFFSIFYLLVRAFYSMGDTRTPMLVNLVALAINIAVDVTLFAVLPGRNLKVAGLAVGNGSAYVVGGALLLWILHRRAPRPARRLSLTFVRSAVAAAATGVGAWVVARSMDSHVGAGSAAAQTVQILGSVGAGLLIYAVVAYLLRMEELSWMREVLFRRRP
jgi:putative peptidoglycan lipid II flippase